MEGLWRPLSEASNDKCGVTTLGSLTHQLLAKNILSMHPVTLDSQGSLASPIVQEVLLLS